MISRRGLFGVVLGLPLLKLLRKEEPNINGSSTITYNRTTGVNCKRFEIKDVHNSVVKDMEEILWKQL